MSNDIVDFPDRTAIDAEAAEWLIRLDGDRALPSDERAALKAWIGRSAVHRAALVDLARLWGRMNVLTALRVPLGEVPRRRRIRRAVRRVAFASGAAAVVVGAAALLTYRMLGGGRSMAGNQWAVCDSHRAAAGGRSRGRLACAP